MSNWLQANRRGNQSDWRWSKCVSPPTNYSSAFTKVLQAWVSKRSFNLPENLSGSHARAYFHITPFRFWVIRQSVYCLPFIFLISIIVLTSWWLSVFALPDSSTGLNAYLIICHRYHAGGTCEEKNWSGGEISDCFTSVLRRKLRFLQLAITIFLFWGW